MNARILALVLVAMTYSMTTVAALPPMPKEELEANADLIVNATVRKIDKNGEVRKDDCYHWQDYRAELTVEKVNKGDDKLTTIHVRYANHVKDVGDCVGGSTPYSMDLGAQYELYLRRADDGDYTFISYSGVNKIADKGPVAPDVPTAEDPDPEPPVEPAPPEPGVVVDPVPPPAAKGGGCGCTIEPASSSLSRFSLALLFLGLFVTRRRR